MKKYFYVTTLALGILVASCGEQGKNKVNSSEAQSAVETKGEALVVDPAASSIAWVGFAPTKQHNGTIAIKSGNVTVGANDSISGSFVIDMATINVLDLEAGKGKEDLQGHLSSKDFFEVENFPESHFVITGVAKQETDSTTHVISGNLKMKDTERNISFPAKVTKEGNSYKVTSIPFTIDRTQWNVMYGAASILGNVKDGLINDNIELQITVVANPESAN